MNEDNEILEIIDYICNAPNVTYTKTGLDSYIINTPHILLAMFYKDSITLSLRHEKWWDIINIDLTQPGSLEYAKKRFKLHYEYVHAFMRGHSLHEQSYP